MYYPKPSIFGLFYSAGCGAAGFQGLADWGKGHVRCELARLSKRLIFNCCPVAGRAGLKVTAIMSEQFSIARE